MLIRKILAAAAGCLFVLAALPFTAHAQSALPPTPPVMLAVNPITNKLYVANGPANSVTSMDLTTGTSTTIAVGADPSFVAVNPLTNQVYVDNSRDATLSVIDGATDTLVGTFPVGSSGPISINTATNVAYIVRMTGTGSDEVTYFNGNTNSWYTIATNSFQPTAMTVNPVTDTIYVAHYSTGDVRVISGAFVPSNDFPATTSIGVFSHPFAVAANAVTNKVYVITQDTNGPISIIDGATNNIVFPALAAGHGLGPQSLVVNPVSNKAYAAFRNEVIVIDGATNALTYVPIAGASSGAISLGLDYTRNRIYAATALGTLNVIDGDSDTVVSSTAISTDASSVAVNPITNTVFVYAGGVAAMAGAAGSTHAIPLTTTITPFPGNTSGASNSVTLHAQSAFAPNAPAVRKVFYRMDSTVGPWTEAAPSGAAFTASFASLAPGAHTLFAFAVDDQLAKTATGPESNPLVGAIASYAFSVSRGSATVSLASSLNPSTAGQAVTFTASVSGSSGTPTGSVTFTDGGATLCTSVALASGSATCTVSTLASGTHAISAAYSGDATYGAASSGPLSQTVNPPARVNASVALTSSANPSTTGQLVTFTAAVSGSAGAPTGSVSFFSDASPIAGCGAVALATAHAACSTAGLAAGNHSITAQYSGDAAYNAATSAALTQTVTVPPPTTADVSIAQSAGRVTAGQDVAITLTVGNAGPIDATGIRVTDTLPSGLAFGSASAGCSNAAGTVTCDIATLAAGASVQLSIVVHTSSAGTFGNSASVSAAQADPSTANNTSSLAIIVDAAPPPPPPAPTNTLLGVSTRMQVLTGDDVLIGGFVIGGGTPKTVIVRARGPSTGVAGALADPTLTLVPANGDPATFNDDWGSAPNAAQIASSGLAPANAKESAIMATLAPGAYTAIVRGAANTTGVAIVEVLEVDHPEVPLTALSTRGRVQTGDNVMIGGFVIPGSAPRTVLVRARGPSLASQGVSGVLADPTLTIVPANGDPSITNDDWGSGPNAAQIAASGLAPADAKESAILVTLNPGAYTAVVSGVGGTSGVAIVEVFAQ